MIEKKECNLKKEVTKEYKDKAKEQKREDLLNKQIQNFLERFKDMTPAEQKKCIEKLHYEAGLIEDQMKDTQKNLSDSKDIHLSDKQNIILRLSTIILGYVAGGATLLAISDLSDMDIGWAMVGCIEIGFCGGMLGYLGGNLLEVLIEHGPLKLFRKLKTNILNKRMIKYEDKQLILTKQLESIDSQQSQTVNDLDDISELRI